jgi:hypothetical protein
MAVTDNLVPYQPRTYPEMPEGAKLWAVDSYKDIGNSVTVLIETLKDLESATAPATHTHVIADVTGLQTALDDLDTGKADVSHTHAESDITGLVSDLAGKAAAVHTHAISDVTSLQSTLDAKETYGEYNVINTQTGTTYTLALVDKGALVEMNNGSAMTLTVPPNASVAFPTKSRIDIVRHGAGELSIAPGSGVTINSQDAKLRLNKQFSGASLYKRGTNEWTLVGDLKT